MESNFSAFELTLTRSLLGKKSAGDIAGILSRDINDVESLITDLTKGGRKTYAETKAAKEPSPHQLELLQKRRLREEARQKKEAKRLEDQKRKNLDNAGFEKRKMKREQKIPTRAINLEGTIRVQLNSKTIVWVKPGTDIEKLKLDLKIK
jgi:hypothetical protein